MHDEDINRFFIVSDNKRVAMVSVIYMGMSGRAMHIMNKDVDRWEKLGYDVKVYETSNEAEIT